MIRKNVVEIPLILTKVIIRMEISVIQINPNMLIQIKMTTLNQNEIQEEVEVEAEAHHGLTEIEIGEIKEAKKYGGTIRGKKVENVDVEEVGVVI